MDQSPLQPSSKSSQNHNRASPSKESSQSNQKNKKATSSPGLSSREKCTPSPIKSISRNTPSTSNRRRKPLVPARQVYIPINDPTDHWTDSEDEYDRNGRPRKARVTVKGYQAYLEKRKNKEQQYDIPRPTRKVEKLFENYQGQTGPPTDNSTKGFWVPKKEERLLDGETGGKNATVDRSLLEGELLLPGHPEFPEYGGSDESN
ncbi:hypothetical protein HYFRA_00000471 [Hymenoscyphus fraxineus]|uniref:Uncharacterized protein n=1 Tax=Hymenoscyphus fraxineus TaxID=746836 RepID=A0A9N9L5J4_9HELO|nr:hypothetical protein HYFRA_00000471 [Hymenoscyphus fraxineus]